VKALKGSSVRKFSSSRANMTVTTRYRYLVRQPYGITAKQLSVIPVIRKEVAGKLETPKDVSDSQYILSASTGLVGKLSTA